MKDLFKPGDSKTHTKQVSQDDLATFASGNVHPFCATFALAREMEWSSRLFVLEMIDEEEEGIGTILEINHLSPALEGDELAITATISSVIANEIVCSIEVKVGHRLIARGLTGQKILKKTKIATLISDTHQNG